jgi:hypothetical protein
MIHAPLAISNGWILTVANLTTDQRPTDADPRAYSIGIRYELVEGDWMYVGSVAELPDVHVYERSSCEAYSATLTTIENLREHNRDCGIAFPEPIQYRSAT